MNTCKECDRPWPSPRPPVPTTAITYCAECHVPFSIDELRALFSEANMYDSNAARQFRREIVDDLITALRKSLKETP
jgi:hypothetical protein